ncbi:4-demethylwyosine synthase TYW1 [Candidatus Bathyarchaeota archaeon]|nr:4-demethylwyosine synthase TYW1 [Candidatus Bathyarchaeota archaeon]
MPQSLMQILKRQKYHLVGRHSAVKRCRWLHESLVKGRPCYKQKFYGIKTHQCIQMTPVLFNCTQRCLFCWRAQSGDQEIVWNEVEPLSLDSPDEIVENCVRTQIRILSGYKGNPQTDLKKFTEALTPKHVAISLSGEPLLYERLGELIGAFRKKGFTTFLVTNGTMPSELANLGEEPTQLYVSVCASDEKAYKRVCRPQIGRAWEKLNQTLALLPSFKCPTVVRVTLSRGLNMSNIEGYAKTIEKANPTYVEPKAYMHVGFSRLRLGFENMPSHGEIRDFAVRLAHVVGYNVVDESESNRVVLLSRLAKPVRFDLP